MLLPSGKFRGLPVRDVPDDYLRWYFNTYRDQMPSRLEDAIFEEFMRRGDEFLPPDSDVDIRCHIREAVELGFRELKARRYFDRYPDCDMEILDIARRRALHLLGEDSQ